MKTDKTTDKTADACLTNGAIADESKSGDVYWAHSVEWFNEAFTNPTTREPYTVPLGLRIAAQRICTSYDIQGICDPMYIANVIAVELGIGDGQSTFKI